LGGRAGGLGAGTQGTAAMRHLKSPLRQPERQRVSLLRMDTFLVRVWRPQGEERPEGLRGTAVHVSSGRAVTFTAPEALVRFLADAGGPEGDVAPAQRIDRHDLGE
jgi:hypothetical protein